MAFWLWGSLSSAAGEEAWASKAEVQAVRELKARAWGRPRLEADAKSGEVALDFAELSLAASSGGTSAAGLAAQDYDALFALIQRYQDDLLKLGWKVPN